MTAIDVHAHYYPPEYVARLGTLVGQPGRVGQLARRFFSNRQVQQVPAFTGALDERIELLDRAGVQIQILSFASMNVYGCTEAERAALAAAFNDGCSAAATGYSGRFRFFATMPVPFVDAAIRESRRVRALDGFAGYSLPTHVDGMPIDDPRLTPLFEEWNRTASLVFVHPDGFCVPGALTAHSLEWGLGAPLEDTIAAVRLLRSGVLERFPSLTWIVPHLGGVLPFLWHRLTWRWALDAVYSGGADLPAMSMERLLIDTANSSPGTLALAATALPGTRLVLGSDFPFLDGEALERTVAMVRAAGAHLDPDDVLHMTIGRYLPQSGIVPATSAAGQN
jgi:predicted TIM-barrel fold metal-dependent hydrolase